MRNTIAIVMARLLLAPVLLLSACEDAPGLAGYGMMQDSDACRAASILKTDAPSAQSRTADERQADYDRTYHACMAANGY